ncbi:adenosylcobinamide-GDP ribazoletransferase [Levilactobacillus yiduensis]|uniref:adenosylcobinamide-GDP ribazoletransferase n=1 Tax=Levilactobacillus yiduensis TaxID=2953880 RepID=UPI000EF31453|nr:adenosylcobinamide-GDP ribazoletransferase [Levilactobacillus yiduensis]AYM02476.1 adenosylcobinamide-GDP ribazoletransferase [Levilactobacillus brevis]
MIKSLILFSQFFTRIYIPVEIDDVTNKFKTSIQYITLFGFLLGILEALVFGGLSLVFPIWLSWCFFWVLDGFVTGGFHLDALADTADGLFSSRTTDRIFEIMKDSRLGTMGSLALLYFYMAVIGCGIALSAYLDLWTMMALAAIMIMLTKTGVSLLFYKMIYAGSKGGLASIWTGVKTWRVIVAQLFSIIVIGAALQWQGIVGYVCVVVVAWLYRHHIIRIMGGFSGDTVGAYANLAQVVFLLGYLVAVRFS